MHVQWAWRACQELVHHQVTSNLSLCSWWTLLFQFTCRTCTRQFFQDCRWAERQRDTTNYQLYSWDISRLPRHVTWMFQQAKQNCTLKCAAHGHVVVHACIWRVRLEDHIWNVHKSFEQRSSKAWLLTCSVVWLLAYALPEYLLQV